MGRKKDERKQGFKSFSCKLPQDLLDQIEKVRWDLRMQKGEVVQAALEEFFKKYEEKYGEKKAAATA